MVYDGKYPIPDRRVRTNGGKTFEKILGAGASNLENFLIKRRLMGPGWLRIYDPAPLGGVLDSASDESTKHMTALSLVRPVNFNSNGAMAQFPR